MHPSWVFSARPEDFEARKRFFMAVYVAGAYDGDGSIYLFNGLV